MRTNLKTIQKQARIIQDLAVQYKSDLPNATKEQLAADIYEENSDAFRGWQDIEWQRKFPAANEIDMRSLDLEISNTSDADEDWDQLIGFIEAFNKQIDLLCKLEVAAKKICLKLNKLVQKYNKALTKAEKENLAQHIHDTILSLSKDFRHDDVHDAYPTYDKLATLSGDLARGYAHNVDEDWQKLLAAIDEFNMQVNGQN